MVVRDSDDRKKKRKAGEERENEVKGKRNKFSRVKNSWSESEGSMTKRRETNHRWKGASRSNAAEDRTAEAAASIDPWSRKREQRDAYG